MNEALETFEAQEIAFMELIAVIENNEVDFPEKVRKAYAFVGLTLENATTLGGSADVQERIRELEAALGDTQVIVAERESSCQAAVERAEAAERKNNELEDEMKGLDQEYTRQITDLEKENSRLKNDVAYLEKENFRLEKELQKGAKDLSGVEVPDGVVKAHRWVVAGLKLFGKDDYDKAVGKLVSAVKELEKVTGMGLKYE